MSNVQVKRHKREETYLGEASRDSLSTVHPFLLQFGGPPFCAAGTSTPLSQEPPRNCESKTCGFVLFGGCREQETKHWRPLPT